jgi:predicted O-methyltransferase YrrM
MRDFDATARAIAGIPFMSPAQGRLVYDHIRSTNARDVLELGTAHGVGAAYMAAAGANVTTVDFQGAHYDPSPESTLAKAGVTATIVREYSSYTWWLKTQVEAHDEPRYDFVYLDGAKNWTIDGLAVILVEKLLRPGGWLLMDDLEWTYAQDPHREATDGIVHRELSEPERTQPHLRAVFDLIVAQHPSFTELRREDEWWGWARKNPGAPRTYTVTTSQSLAVLATNVARRLARKARRRVASLR